MGYKMIACSKFDLVAAGRKGDAGEAHVHRADGMDQAKPPASASTSRIPSAWRMYKLEMDCEAENIKRRQTDKKEPGNQERPSVYATGAMEVSQLFTPGNLPEDISGYRMDDGSTEDVSCNPESTAKQFPQ
jgi:hypothetical protein